MDHTLTLRIEGLGFSAEGWTRHEEGFISTPHCLPGDLILATVSPFRRGRAWAQAQHWLERSPQHHPPGCPHDDHCSGCATRHMHPDHERDWKLQAAREILLRYAPSLPQLPIAWIDANTRQGHRTRGALRPEVRKDKLHLGLRSTALDGHIHDVRDCTAQHPTWQRLMQTFAQALDPHTDLATSILSVELRLGDPGQALFLLRLTDPLPIPFLHHFALQHQLPLGVFLPDQHEPHMLHGQASLTLTLANIPIQVPWSSWYHPHREASLLLAQWVADTFDHDHDFLLDLCSGVGTASLGLATSLSRMISVDEDRHALLALQQAALRAGLPQVQTRPGRLGAVLRKLRRELAGQPLPTAALLNPMRKPLGADQLRDLPALGPRQLLYLGPAPASAAKDAALLTDMGFHLTKLAAINLHPGTARFMLALELRR